MLSSTKNKDQEDLQLLANAINLKSVRSIWQVTGNPQKSTVDETGIWTTGMLEHHGVQGHIVFTAVA